MHRSAAQIDQLPAWAFVVLGVTLFAVSYYVLPFARSLQAGGGFWTLHVDTLATSAILGMLVFGFLAWVARGATSGVPGSAT